MRRFNYDDNEEYRKEVDNFFGDEEMSLGDYKEEKTIFDFQFNLAQQELNHRILRTAVRMSENSFWWRFYSLSTRLQIIDRTFKRLRKLEDRV